MRVIDRSLPTGSVKLIRRTEKRENIIELEHKDMMRYSGDADCLNVVTIAGCGGYMGGNQ